MKLDLKIEQIRADLTRDMKELEYRMTIKLGAMMVVAVGSVVSLVTAPLARNGLSRPPVVEGKHTKWGRKGGCGHYASRIPHRLRFPVFPRDAAHRSPLRVRRGLRCKAAPAEADRLRSREAGFKQRLLTRLREHRRSVWAVISIVSVGVR